MQGKTLSVSLATAILTMLGLWITYKSMPSPARIEVRLHGDQLVFYTHNPLGLAIDMSLDVGISPFDSRKVSVETIRAARIEIINRGSELFDWTLPPSVPLVIAWDDRATLIDVQRHSANGTVIPSEIVVSDDWTSFSLYAPYVNPRESILLDILYTGETPSLKVKGRLRDHETIGLEPISTSIKPTWSEWLLLVVVTALAIGVSASQLRNVPAVDTVQRFAAVSAFFSFALLASIVGALATGLYLSMTYEPPYDDFPMLEAIVIYASGICVAIALAWPKWSARIEAMLKSHQDAAT